MNGLKNKVHLVEEALRQEILAQRWAVGEKIPSESELALRFDCSIGTVSKAVSMLAHDGLVQRKTRLGTWILRNEPEVVEAQLDAYAFIYPSDKNEGIWRSVAGFQGEAQKRNRRVVTLSCGTDYRKEAEYLARLAEFDVRGAVMHPVTQTSQDYVNFLQMLVATAFPIVLVGVSVTGVSCPAVMTDGFHAGYIMTRHLLERGLTRVGFFTDHARGLTLRDRYQGYRWALKEAGVEENQDWLWLDESFRPNDDDPLVVPMRMATDYLRRATGVQGVVCSHDFLAVGMIRAARELGLSVPQDLKVTGIDGYGVANQGDISLTTYQGCPELAGRKAFELLDDLVRGVPVANREVLMRGELLVRESSC